MTAQFCSQCGAELEAGARFCTKCGTPQSKQPRPAAQKMPPRSFPLPLILLIAGVLLLAGGVLVYFLNQPDDSAAVTTATTAAVTESNIPYPEVERISVAESKMRADAGTAVIVDVRDQEDYQILHAANAISLPISELSARHGELPRDIEILTYCT